MCFLFCLSVSGLVSCLGSPVCENLWKSTSVEMGPKNLSHPAIVELDGAHWFQEKSEESFPGQRFCLEVEEILHHSQSQFQDILIFKSKTFGNVLVLNGIIQCTEKDEFAYQELITHTAIMSHEKPSNVLVIGGGDCGVVRELVKHLDRGVDTITMVEIDDMVIKLLAQYLPHMAKFHDHPRVNIVIDDGFKFLRENRNKFDVIITDSSDPEGPAEEFFRTSYFELLSNALSPKGVVIMQSSENVWLNIDKLKELVGSSRQVFENVKYCQCYMPSYTSGQLGLIVATHNTAANLTQPLRKFAADEETELFQYYSAAVHQAAFVLPRWAADINDK